MAWIDVPAKLVLWQAAEYYQTEPDGVTSLISQFGGTPPDINTVPIAYRTDFEARLDYYLSAVSNLAVSRAIDPKLLNQG